MAKHHVGPFDLMYNMHLGKAILAGIGLIVMGQINYFIKVMEACWAVESAVVSQWSTERVCLLVVIQSVRPQSPTGGGSTADTIL